MRTVDQWLSEYAESHQNATNKVIHNVCVPVIFFVIIALLWKMSFFLFIAGAAGACFFYYQLSPKLAMVGGAVILGCVLVQVMFGFGVFFLVVLFALAWVGQFYGHKLEGKKPSFFDDLQFLLTTPIAC